MGKSVGVLELINKLDSVNFTNKDLTLLNIFADYTSTLIQNALDAKRYQDFSICDSLTGLYNDRYFFDTIPIEVRRALKKTKKKSNSDLYLVFVDIDNLKRINDTHGHLAGNRVLSQIGSLLALTKITKRTSISRYGGDEFVIIVPDSDLDSIVEYSEILRAQVETNVFLRLREITAHESRTAHVTASIGIASLRKNVSLKMKEESIIKCLIKQADTAMYRSKNTGKNKVSIAEGKLSL
jgi:diguanylate cyclase (GGDEF)-like protein